VVNAAPRTLATFQVRPSTLAADSAAALGMNGSLVLPIIARDPGDTAISGVVTYLTSSKPTVVGFASAWTTGNATVNGLSQGTALITATTWVMGVSKTDTFTVRVGLPVLDTVLVNAGCYILGNTAGCDHYALSFLADDSLTIAVGGTVAFVNGDGFYGNIAPMNVVFDDSTAAQAVGTGAAGNAYFVFPFASELRTWTAPGHYGYTVSAVGDSLARSVRGVVVVKQNDGP
jgi:hypothetical protein